MIGRLLDTIGGTPVVQLQRLAPPGAHVYAKIESANPGGSIKDRMALAVIEAAERSGKLRPGQTVIEASSGNSGISLAMVCAAKGYPLVVVMAEQFSVERRRLMRFLGARVVLTPAALKGSGMVAKARELAQAHGWFWCQQFDNPANAQAHANGTAREILQDFDGRRLDAVVLGAGTGGTLRGVAQVLRRERPGVRVLVCEPENAPVLAGGLAMPGEAGESHPAFRPHPMQGWTPDFIPGHTAAAIADGLVHRVLPVDAARAIALSRELARREGLLCGITSGATLDGALQFCREVPDAHVLCLFPDTAERYLSTPLFEGVAQDMDAEEWAIARSTPGARFDRPQAAPAAAPVAATAADPGAAAFVEVALSDRAAPVTVFGLAWCDYSASLRQLLDRCGVVYRCIELDTPAMQAEGFGNQVRAALRARTGMATLPQVFVSGELLGGCSETFASYRDGRLVERLQSCGAMPADWPCFNAEALLPQWRQPVAA